MLKLLENKGKRKADGLSNPDLEERRQGALCPREACRPGTVRAGHRPLARLPTQSQGALGVLRQVDRVPSLPGAACQLGKGMSLLPLILRKEVRLANPSFYRTGS